jgi:hypothetical protein
MGVTKCPLCLKSMLPPDAMRHVWRETAREVRETPMPPEYAAMRVRVLCNDCREQTVTRFHIVALRCEACKGYNTTRTGEGFEPVGGGGAADVDTDGGDDDDEADDEDGEGGGGEGEDEEDEEDEDEEDEAVTSPTPDAPMPDDAAAGAPAPDAPAPGGV